jgi:hypothetical protein
MKKLLFLTIILASIFLARVNFVFAGISDPCTESVCDICTGAAIDTCGDHNATQWCAVVAPYPCKAGGGRSYTCGYNNCSAGKTCSGGACVAVTTTTAKPATTTTKAGSSTTTTVKSTTTTVWTATTTTQPTTSSTTLTTTTRVATTTTNPNYITCNGLCMTTCSGNYRAGSGECPYNSTCCVQTTMNEDYTCNGSCIPACGYDQKGGYVWRVGSGTCPTGSVCCVSGSVTTSSTTATTSRTHSVCWFGSTPAEASCAPVSGSGTDECRTSKECQDRAATTTTTTTTPGGEGRQPTCTVGDNGEADGNCGTCNASGDDQCGTFQSTKSCTKTKIYVNRQLSSYCTTATNNATCTINNKTCVDSTKTCVNNKCQTPGSTTTSSTTSSSTTASSTTATNGSTTTTTIPPTTTTTIPTCLNGEHYPYYICKSLSCAQVKACGTDSGGCTGGGGLCGLTDGNTYLSLVVGLDGLGTTGDNQNPEDKNCSNAKDKINCGSNKNPNNSTREATAEFFAIDNSIIISTFSGQVNYTTGATNSGKFTGAIDVMSQLSDTNKLPNGTYIVKIKSPGYLKRQLPGTVTITSGQVNILPAIRLVTGNVNQDASLDITDYTVLMSCSDLSQDNKASCKLNTNYPLRSDLDDNGVIDQIDYTLLMREWINQIEQ